MAKRLLVGAGVGSGIATAPAFVLPNVHQRLGVASGVTGRPRIQAIQVALETVAAELELSAETHESADVLNALSAMLRDPVLLETIKAFLAEGSGAERGIRGAFNSFARKLEKAGGYFAERSQDLTALSARVIDELSGAKSEPQFPNEPFVLVAAELSPLLASTLKKTKAVGILTERGSATSHSAIIVRGANLPTVMGAVGIQSILNGEQILLDATSGQVFIEPTPEEIRHYSEAAYPSTAIMLTIPDPDDIPVAILANLGSSFEVPTAIRAGAQGVGLYRTELLYLGEDNPPSKDAQIFEYTKLLAGFQGKRVVVRVLDIDVDKPLPFLKPAGHGRYANRGLQVLLANPEVLRTQLEALAAAAEYYPATELWVMAPMVLDEKETKAFVTMARAAGLAHVGIMIEVPEIAKPRVLAKVLKLVDFLSIGTNDLTQYVLGKNRYGSAMPLSDARNHKVLSVIDSVIRAGKAAGKPVGVCGEAASDPVSAKVFIAMGVDSLSASPSLIPALASALSEA